MLNHIVIHGRLTANPELRQTQSGVSVCNFNVAVNRSYKNGEEEQTDYFTVVCWRGLADIVSKYFVKGKEIIVAGEMQSRKWQDDSGNNRTSWEIQANTVDFCGNKNSYNSEGEKQMISNADVFVEVTDEDVPF